MAGAYKHWYYPAGFGMRIDMPEEDKIALIEAAQHPMPPSARFASGANRFKIVMGRKQPHSFIESDPRLLAPVTSLQMEWEVEGLYHDHRLPAMLDIITHYWRGRLLETRLALPAACCAACGYGVFLGGPEQCPVCRRFYCSIICLDGHDGCGPI